MLKKIEIEHFRGFYDKQSLEFAIPNGAAGSGLTLIVGPSDSGKTTLLECLLFEKEGDKRFKENDRHKNNPPKITIESDNKNDKVTFTNIENGSLVKKEGDHKIKFSVIKASKEWNPYSSSHQELEHYISSTSRIDLRKASILDTCGVLKHIFDNSIFKEEFNKLVRQVIPDFFSWTIDSDNRGDYVKYEDAKGNKHSIDLLGNGSRSILSICAHFLENSKGKVIIIDEADSSLDQPTQEALARLISEKSKDRQIIVCAHSPYFVRWEDFINGAKLVRLNKTSEDKCQIFWLKNGEDYGKFINNSLLEWQKPQLLDTTAKEIFFAKKILFLEGQEDVGLIRKWLSDNNINILFKIFGYGVGGHGNFKTFLNLAKNLGFEKVAVLYDGGGEEKKSYEESKKEFDNYCIEILPTQDIRDKYSYPPDSKLLKEGCFDKNGNLKLDRKEEFENIMNKIINYMR